MVVEPDYGDTGWLRLVLPDYGDTGWLRLILPKCVEELNDWEFLRDEDCPWPYMPITHSNSFQCGIICDNL